MIEINNLSRSLVDKRILKVAAEIVLRGERKKSAELSIVLAGESEIKKLNKKYRKKNKATDVLAFGQIQNPCLAGRQAKATLRGVRFASSKIQNLIEELGEVIICPSVVKKNAEKFDSNFKKELIRVLIHGILHLLGYEHERGGKKAEKMAEKEEYYLSKMNYPAPSFCASAKRRGRGIPTGEFFRQRNPLRRAARYLCSEINPKS